jgi:hypothetical protein
VNPGGVFVQWVQLYEIDGDLVASIMKAIALNFEDYAVYAPNSGDILVVARAGGALPPPDPAMLSLPAFAEALTRVHIRNPQDLEGRRIGGRDSLERFFAAGRLPANSDYRPVLDQNAARARFLGASAQELLRLGSVPLPLVAMLSPHGAPEAATRITFDPGYPRTRLVRNATSLRDFMLTRTFSPQGAELPAALREYARQTDRLLHECGSPAPDANRLTLLFNTAKNMIPYLTPDEAVGVLAALQEAPCAAALTPVEKRYLALFLALGRRDAAARTYARFGPAALGPGPRTSSFATSTR